MSLLVTQDGAGRCVARVQISVRISRKTYSKKVYGYIIFFEISILWNQNGTVQRLLGAGDENGRAVFLGDIKTVGGRYAGRSIITILRLTEVAGSVRKIGVDDIDGSKAIAGCVDCIEFQRNAGGVVDVDVRIAPQGL